MFFKLKYFLFLIFFFFIFFLGWNVVDGDYDKQNKIILFLKKIVPISFARKARDTIFIIPDLKTQNRELRLQVKKFEQGYSGNLVKQKKIFSESKKKEIEIKEFFLPFPRMDTRMGHDVITASLRAHYLEIIDDIVLVISGEGETIYFAKNNINSNTLNQKKIPNNIQNILKNNKARIIGIRDLFYLNNEIYISMLTENQKGITINIYKANFNLKKIEFDLFFETHEYWKDFNVFSGGRIEKFIDDQILFSIGFSKDYEAPQHLNSLLGKIISINLKTKKYKFISIGHRNPQGLYFSKEDNLIINSEHGPQGGDEINFNFFKTYDEIKNFGWPEVSYGKAYPGEEDRFKPYTFKSTHVSRGFFEPKKFYTPAIGISEIMLVKKNNKIKLFVSSLRAASMYVYELDEKFNFLSEERFFFGHERIRDIKYDEKEDFFLIILEFVPSIGFFKYNY